VVDRTKAAVDARETADAEEDAATPSTTWLSVEETTRALRRDMYAAQRKALVEARNAGELDDEVMRGELEHLDYEEAATAFDRGAP
jgi:CPA1 family monovalent cation:H+ antiporter